MFSFFSSFTSWSPTTVVMDFEMALKNAFEEELDDDTTIKMCYFHFCQSLWRKIQELGLAGQCCML